MAHMAPTPWRGGQTGQRVFAYDEPDLHSRQRGAGRVSLRGRVDDRYLGEHPCRPPAACAAIIPGLDPDAQDVRIPVWIEVR